jgi:prefoldin alpha subunit
MKNPKLPPREYVELEMVNQRLTELNQSLQMTEQQLEQVSIALAVMKELQSSKEGQELLVPIGGGVFFSVERSAISDIKVAVGAGIVVDKSNEDAQVFVQKQFDELQAYYQKLITTYDLTAQKAQQLQEEIDRKM